MLRLDDSNDSWPSRCGSPCSSQASGSRARTSQPTSVSCARRRTPPRPRSLIGQVFHQCGRDNPTHSPSPGSFRSQLDVQLQGATDRTQTLVYPLGLGRGRRANSTDRPALHPLRILSIPTVALCSLNRLSRLEVREATYLYLGYFLAVGCPWLWAWCGSAYRVGDASTSLSGRNWSWLGQTSGVSAGDGVIADLMVRQAICPFGSLC